MDIGEITASAAGDQDLFPYSIGVIEHQHTPATFSGLDGAHEARGSAAQHDCVVGVFHAVRIQNTGWAV